MTTQLQLWRVHVEALHADGHHDKVLSVSIAAVEQLDAEIWRLRTALQTLASAVGFTLEHHVALETDRG